MQRAAFSPRCRPTPFSATGASSRQPVLNRAILRARHLRLWNEGKRRGIAQFIVCAKSSKGFGKAEIAVENNPKGGKKARQPDARQQSQSLQQDGRARQPFAAGADPSLISRLEEDEKMFEERLKRLQRKAKAMAESGVKSSDSTQAFDTFMDSPVERKVAKKADSKSDDAGSPFLNPTVAVAIGFLGAMAVLLISISTDLGGPPQRRPPAQNLSEKSRKDMEQQAGKLAAQLKERRDDVELLKESAALAGALGNLKDAAESLERVTELQPDDAENWSRYGMARLQMGEARAAAAALERALAELPQDNDLDTLQALTEALASDGRPERAVAAVAGVRERLLASTSREASTYELDLLEAKVLAEWRGHTSEALTRYDSLIARFPEDFRAYLAKGQLLAAEGRAGDAQRYYIQARYWAPDSARGLVDRVISASSS